MNQTMMTTEIKDRLRLAAAKAYVSTAKNRPRGLSIEALAKIALPLTTRPEGLRDFDWNYQALTWLKTEIHHLLADDQQLAKTDLTLPTWIVVPGVRRPATGYRFRYSYTDFWAYIQPRDRAQLRANHKAEAQVEAEREREQAERARRLVEAVRVNLQLSDAAAAINEIQAVVGGGRYSNYDSMREHCGVAKVNDQRQPMGQPGDTRS